MNKPTGSNGLHSHLAGIPVGDKYPARIVGVVNVSPESFFKGSVSASVDSIRRNAEQMVADGADILDVGARGTAPYLKTNAPIYLTDPNRLANCKYEFVSLPKTIPR